MRVETGKICNRHHWSIGVDSTGVDSDPFPLHFLSQTIQSSSLGFSLPKHITSIPIEPRDQAWSEYSNDWNVPDHSPGAAAITNLSPMASTFYQLRQWVDPSDKADRANRSDFTNQRQWNCDQSRAGHFFNKVPNSDLGINAPSSTGNGISDDTCDVTRPQFDRDTLTKQPPALKKKEKRNKRHIKQKKGAVFHTL